MFNKLDVIHLKEPARDAWSHVRMSRQDRKLTLKFKDMVLVKKTITHMFFEDVGSNYLPPKSFYYTGRMFRLVGLDVVNRPVYVEDKC